MKKWLIVKALIVCMAFMAISVYGQPIVSTYLMLHDIDGKHISLADYKGKVIIVDFFATWCPPCKQEIPEFVELQKKYGNEGFAMIGISLSRQSDTKSFSKNFGINYPVLIDDGSAAAMYGPVRSIPMTLVIDKNFKVVKKYIGYKSKDVFEQDIKELLK